MMVRTTVKTEKSEKQRKMSTGQENASVCQGQSQ